MCITSHRTVTTDILQHTVLNCLRKPARLTDRLPLQRAWEELYYASHFMMHLVPVINPILYALMHENFRRAATVTCPWLPSKVGTKWRQALLQFECNYS